MIRKVKTDAGERIEYEDGILTIVQDPDDPAWRIFTFIGDVYGAPLTQIDRLPAVRNDLLPANNFDTTFYPAEFRVPKPRGRAPHRWTKKSDTLYKCECGSLEWRPVGVLYELRADNHELFNLSTIKHYGPLTKTKLNDGNFVRRWNRYASTWKLERNRWNYEQRDERTWQMAELEIIARCLNKTRDRHWSPRYDSAIGEAFENLKQFRNSVVAPQRRPKARTLRSIVSLLSRLDIPLESEPKIVLTKEDLFLRLLKQRKKDALRQSLYRPV